MPVSRKMNSLGTEAAFEVLAKARALEAQGKSVVHLEIGEPDFETPENIVEAGIEAMRQGFTHYGPTAGLPELREAIARNVEQTRGIKIDRDQVIVTPGGKPIMFFTILALAERGAEVIYPNPGFPVYESMIRFCGARAVPMRFLEEKGYHPDLEDLAGKLNSKTRLIILNSPQNPAGSAFTAEEMETLAGLLKDHPQTYILSDEIYKDILYEGVHQSIAALPEVQARTIILDGFSKSYAMTGWRLGYGVFPEELVPHITRLAANSVSCAATFIQKAAIEALEGDQEPVVKMVEEFRRRRDAVVEGLRKIPGVSCPLPEGAFYVFPSIRNTGITSHEFQERALPEAGLALLGGHSFGKYGEGYLRLSYANSLENLQEALRRLQEFIVKNSRPA